MSGRTMLLGYLILFVVQVVLWAMRVEVSYWYAFAVGIWCGFLIGCEWPGRARGAGR